MRNGSVLLVIGMGLVLAACGGGTTGASTATGSPPAATSGPTDATGGQPSAEASVGAPSEAPPSTGGGGPAAGICELVTADELADIFGVASVKTTVIAGPPDNCIVVSDTGDPLTAWSLTTAQASTLFDAFTGDPSTVTVPGIGDKAAIVQGTGLLVLKGGSLLVISISGGADMSPEEGIEAAKRIGTAAAGRL